MNVCIADRHFLTHVGQVFYQRQTGNFVFVVRPVVMIKVAIGGGENDMPCRVAGGASKS